MSLSDAALTLAAHGASYTSYIGLLVASDVTIQGVTPRGATECSTMYGAPRQDCLAVLDEFFAAIHVFARCRVDRLHE